MAIFSLHLFCRGMNNLNVQNAAMVGKAPKIGVLNPPSAAQMLSPQQSRAQMPQKMQAGHIVQNAQNVENVERAGKKFALPKIKKELPLTTKIAFACQAAVAAIATVFTVKGIINLVKKFKK